MHEIRTKAWIAWMTIPPPTPEGGGLSPENFGRGVTISVSQEPVKTSQEGCLYGNQPSCSLPKPFGVWAPVYGSGN